MLEVLEINGCIVTIEAMGTQKEIAKSIKEKEDDCVLTLKRNQGEQNEMVEDLFSTGFANDFKNLNVTVHNDVYKGHGRLEERTCYALKVPKYFEHYQQEWSGLKTFVCIESKRESNGYVEIEKRFILAR